MANSKKRANSLEIIAKEFKEKLEELTLQNIKEFLQEYQAHVESVIHTAHGHWLGAEVHLIYRKVHFFINTKYSGVVGQIDGEVVSFALHSSVLDTYIAEGFLTEIRPELH